jgi:hypothetical protein
MKTKIPAVIQPGFFVFDDLIEKIAAGSRSHPQKPDV